MTLYWKVAPNAMLDPPALSAQLAIPEATLSQWRYRKVGPPYVKVGRHIRYRQTDVDAWLDSQRVVAGGS